MLQLPTSKRHSYSGSGSYKYVEGVIKRGRNIAISSPYVDKYYAGFLVRNARGKRIRILSSSIDRDAAKILNGGGIRWWTLKISGFVIAANILLYYARVSYLPLTICSAMLIVACLALLRRGNPGIAVKVPKKFVHAKLYIAENEAVEGSANFTYAGLHKNIEHIEVTTDRREVGELRAQFQRIWDSS